MQSSSALLFVALTCAAGCSGSTSTSPGSPDGGTPAADSGPAPTGTALTGTIDGVPFTSLSALSYANTDGSIDIVLSDKSDLCTRLMSKQLEAGETVVQLLGLTKTSSGSYAPAVDPGDVKVAVLDASCKASYAKGASSSTTSIALTTVDATGVTGTANITFDSTSTIMGSFTAPACGATISENDVCK